MQVNTTLESLLSLTMLIVPRIREAVQANIPIIDVDGS